MTVQVEHLRLEREGRLVLDIPSLEMRGGRTTAVLGPNGAGKTTLLRLIATLDRPTAGRILLDGRPPGADRHTRLDVALTFQEEVFLRQSVRDNLELGLRLRRLGRAERQRRVEEAADLLGIRALLDRRADRLSGGERRRASLARAVCLRAPLVLLDEPLAGLDPVTYRRLLDELPRLLGSLGATTILVTHDHEEALRLAQDVVVLIEGRVHAAGDKRDVVLHPPNAAAAQVLGYTILPAGNRQLAVLAGALKVGPGEVEFQMDVEELLDLVGHREIVGRIGNVRVRIGTPACRDLPRRGARLVVHADRACDVT
jgi:ABC-type sugar transport system ATPase subunit